MTQWDDLQWGELIVKLTIVWALNLFRTMRTFPIFPFILKTRILYLKHHLNSLVQLVKVTRSYN